MSTDAHTPTPQSEPATITTAPPMTATPPDHAPEIDYRRWAGLSADDLLLAAPIAPPPPVRLPAHVWGILVIAVDINQTAAEPANPGCLDLFAWRWQHDQPPADRHDGDLVVQLSAPADRDGADDSDGDHRVKVVMLQARWGRWQRVALWPDLSDDWPSVVACTAAALFDADIDRHEAPIATA